MGGKLETHLKQRVNHQVMDLPEERCGDGDRLKIESLSL